MRQGPCYGQLYLGSGRIRLKLFFLRNPKLSGELAKALPVEILIYFFPELRSVFCRKGAGKLNFPKYSSCPPADLTSLFSDIPSQAADLSAFRAHHSQCRFNQRGLSRPVLPCQSDDTARRQRKINRPKAEISVALCDVPKFQCPAFILPCGLCGSPHVCSVFVQPLTLPHDYSPFLLLIKRSD